MRLSGVITNGGPPKGCSWFFLRWCITAGHFRPLAAPSRCRCRDLLRSVRITIGDSSCPGSPAIRPLFPLAQYPEVFGRQVIAGSPGYGRQTLYFRHPREGGDPKRYRATRYGSLVPGPSLRYVRDDGLIIGLLSDTYPALSATRQWVFVIPAKAGIQRDIKRQDAGHWFPDLRFAPSGMTGGSLRRQ